MRLVVQIEVKPLNNYNILISYTQQSIILPLLTIVYCHLFLGQGAAGSPDQGKTIKQSYYPYQLHTGICHITCIAICFPARVRLVVQIKVKPLNNYNILISYTQQPVILPLFTIVYCHLFLGQGAAGSPDRGETIE